MPSLSAFLTKRCLSDQSRPLDLCDEKRFDL
jgi:hypothetical protein